eukprot:5402926-Prymnesium_polylepis.2
MELNRSQSSSSDRAVAMKLAKTCYSAKPLGSIELNRSHPEEPLGSMGGLSCTSGTVGIDGRAQLHQWN